MATAPPAGSSLREATTHASDADDRTPPVHSRFARLLAVLAIALTLIAVPATMPDTASATQKGRVSEATAMKRCHAAGGSITWYFYEDGINADMRCVLPSGRTFTCVPSSSPFGNIVDCY